VRAARRPLRRPLVLTDRHHRRSARCSTSIRRASAQGSDAARAPALLRARDPEEVRGGARPQRGAAGARAAALSAACRSAGALRGCSRRCRRPGA
jgi:hypothetical protein